MKRETGPDGSEDCDVGIGIDDAVWDHSVFSKKTATVALGRCRCEVSRRNPFATKIKRLLSTDHFSVDGREVRSRPRMIGAPNQRAGVCACPSQ
jgi:hypothetical protein